jgi:site-specific recombinase XerD
MSGYFSTCRRSPKTQAAYLVDLAQFQRYIGGATPLCSIESEAMERWAVEMRESGYASVSIRRKFATVRVFFAYWIRKGIIDKSPLWRIRLDLGRERVLPRSLAPEDAKDLMEAVWRDAVPCRAEITGPSDPRFLRLRNRAALEILFATGIRVGELVSVSLSDWREGERCFVIKGKGSRQRLSFLPDDRSFRAVEMYLEARRGLNIEDQALLVNASGRRITTQGVARVLAHAAAAAGIVSKVTPHMIRHTVATLLLRYGADIRIVQEVLGHASIATTQRYTHVSKEHLVSALKLRHPSQHLNILVPDHALDSLVA